MSRPDAADQARSIAHPRKRRGRPFNALTPGLLLRYFAWIANHEAQVERKRIYNPQLTMTGSGALFSVTGAAQALVGILHWRLH